MAVGELEMARDWPKTVRQMLKRFEVVEIWTIDDSDKREIIGLLPLWMLARVKFKKTSERWG